jgi:hypothetical protein
VCPEQPGSFSVEGEAGQELCRFTANVPIQESDLAEMRMDDFSRSIPRPTEPGNRGFLLALSGDGAMELWRVLLLMGLALLVGEFVLANRTLA